MAISGWPNRLTWSTGVNTSASQLRGTDYGIRIGLEQAEHPSELKMDDLRFTTVPTATIATALVHCFLILMIRQKFWREVLILSLNPSKPTNKPDFVAM